MNHASHTLLVAKIGIMWNNIGIQPNKMSRPFELFHNSIAEEIIEALKFVDSL